MVMEVNGYKIEPAADLSNANLRYANLTDANLTDANTWGAKWRNTTMPDGTVRTNS